MIDIFVPVLGRPHAAAPLVQSIHGATSKEVRITFICSSGDEEEIDACLSTGEEVIVMSKPAGRSDYPKKMNTAFRDTENEWILLGSDDITFEQGWDEQALKAAWTTGASVVSTNDMANGLVRKGLFGTHCLVRREYVVEQGASADGPGVLVHEGYDHNFCDREICGVARSRKTFVFAPRAIIRHNHPNFRRGVSRDSTYAKGMANFRSDQDLFYKRSALWNHEGLLPQEKRLIQRGRRR